MGDLQTAGDAARVLLGPHQAATERLLAMGWRENAERLRRVQASPHGTHPGSPRVVHAAPGEDPGRRLHLSRVRRAVVRVPRASVRRNTSGQPGGRTQEGSAQEPESWGQSVQDTLPSRSLVCRRLPIREGRLEYQGVPAVRHSQKSRGARSCAPMIPRYLHALARSHPPAVCRGVEVAAARAADAVGARADVGARSARTARTVGVDSATCGDNEGTTPQARRHSSSRWERRPCTPGGERIAGCRATGCSRTSRNDQTLSRCVARPGPSRPSIDSLLSCISLNHLLSRNDGGSNNPLESSPEPVVVVGLLSGPGTRSEPCNRGQGFAARQRPVQNNSSQDFVARLNSRRDAPSGVAANRFQPANNCSSELAFLRGVSRFGPKRVVLKPKVFQHLVGQADVMPDAFLVHWAVARCSQSHLRKSTKTWA